MKRILTWTACLLSVALAVICYVRWEAWFGNPAEPPYEPSAEPGRVMLTMGDRGEDSRYVTWMCGDQLDSSACLMLADTLGDTLRLEPIGEVFESRSGKAAYYRVLLQNLQPSMRYTYRIENAGGVTPWYQFTMGDTRSGQFSFLYVGDVQDTIGGVVNELLRAAIERHPEVEFIACAGDLVERPMDKYWAETFRGLEGICTSLPIVNVTGNHDYLKYAIRKCERRFSLVFPYFLEGMEERDDANHLFSFTYHHDTDFFLLDSDRGIGFLYAQRQWLQQALVQSTARHKVVMLHHPIYSVKRESNNRDVRWMFADLLQQSGVELVLQGHEHAYTHCTASDEPLTDTRCVGSPLYVVSHCSPKNYRIRPSKRFHPVHNDSRYYSIVTVDGEGILLRSFDANTQERIDSIRVVTNPK